MMLMVATVLLFTMAPPATLFPILYAFSAWRSTLVGRGLMVMSVAIALLVDCSIAFALIRTDATAAQAIQLFVFLMLNVGLWFMLIVLIRTRMKGKT